VWSGARQRRRGWGAGRCPEVRRRRARRPRIDPRLGAGWSGRRRATRSTRRHVVHHRPRSAVQTSGRRLADVSEESTGPVCSCIRGRSPSPREVVKGDRVRRRGCLRAAPRRGPVPEPSRPPLLAGRQSAHGERVRPPRRAHIGRRSQEWVGTRARALARAPANTSYDEQGWGNGAVAPWTGHCTRGPYDNSAARSGGSVSSVRAASDASRGTSMCRCGSCVGLRGQLWRLAGTRSVARASGRQRSLFGRMKPGDRLGEQSAGGTVARGCASGPPHSRGPPGPSFADRASATVARLAAGSDARASA
jgi:hypothetical protein